MSICTDGAASMTGKNEEFLAKLKQKNADLKFTHCFFAARASRFVAKTLPEELKQIRDVSVKLVYFMKARPLTSRLFKFFAKK